MKVKPGKEKQFKKGKGNKRQDRHVVNKRKQMRKEQRQLKKAKRYNFFLRRNKLLIETTDTKEDHIPEESHIPVEETREKHVRQDKLKEKKAKADMANVDSMKEQEKRERKMLKKQEKEMQKWRKVQLQEDNEAEDRNIRQLEKHLKLKKRKTLPRSFIADGLDYLLEVCDSEKVKELDIDEPNFEDSADEFGEDFAVVTGRKPSVSTKAGKQQEKEMKSKEKIENIDEEEMVVSDESEQSDGKEDTSVEEEDEEESKCQREMLSSEFEASSVDGAEEEKEGHSDKQERARDKRKKVRFAIDGETEEKNIKNKRTKTCMTKTKKVKAVVNEKCDVDGLKDDDMAKNFDDSKERKNAKKQTASGCWEDIYGRLRDKEGNIVQTEETVDIPAGKYMPPARRQQPGQEDAKKQQKLHTLRRQLKGMLNRLAENNLHGIASQIEELYLSHSNNDMNENLVDLMLESVMGQVYTPERLIMENAVLVAILHANVGTEVGAHFLERIVEKFSAMFEQKASLESKEIDNILLLISYIYNFKVVHSVLIFDILNKLAVSFKEKDIDLLLLVLRNIGFTLRKDDPVALKELIVQLQSKAAGAKDLCDQSRVKFMLDILLAIRNNNMQKIPNYNPEHSEHLKKVMKNFIRQGKYVSTLKIMLQDLLNVKNRGRWWIVGSSWNTGLLEKEHVHDDPVASEVMETPKVNKELLDLARKQRMNTDIRRSIFCVIMTSEDYLDAFGKLLRIDMKDHHQRDIICVILDCCLQENPFNAFYAHLAEKFCTSNRKYQMAFQYSLWDKLKELQTFSSNKISNLAQFMVHLFTKMALPISALKVIEFAEMNKAMVKLLRHILLSILLHESEEVCQKVFARIAAAPKLHMMREGLCLFMHHFLLRNKEKLTDEDSEKLEARVKVAEQALTAAEKKVLF